MKLMLLSLMALPCFLSAQNTYTVCNVPGTSANFRTLQGAHDSVAAGSILYVLPSAFSYGNPVFTKKLTIYGTGYFLGSNLAPNTQANTGPVTLQSMTFRAGSDNSYIEGLQFTDGTASNLFPRLNLDTVSNIVVSRCLFTPPNDGGYNYNFMFTPSANNVIVQQCYFSGIATVFFMNGIVITNGFSGFQFNNNIFDGGGVSNAFFFISQNVPSTVTTNATFTNNTIYEALRDSHFGNFNFINNIFIDAAGVTSTTPNTTLNGSNENNIATLTPFFPNTGSNSVGANTDSMFVGSQPGFSSADSKWQLRAGNFAATFGQGGTACGAYGGTSPYHLSGIPNLPFIYSLTVPTQATTPGTISVHIKAHASN